MKTGTTHTPTPVVMTIAGSDSGGGAGIQADLHTFQAHGVFGTTVITAVTAQNRVGVRGVHPIPTEMVRAQFEAVWEDFPVAGIKIGMLTNREIVETVARLLADVRVPIVLDPVMRSTSGHTLLGADAVQALVERLMPLATLITPNAPEAGLLTGRDIQTSEELFAAIPSLQALVPNVAWFVKGGHTPREGKAVDWLVQQDDVVALESPWVTQANTHGTGCRLSAAAISCMVLGQPIHKAVASAKSYLHKLLLDSLQEINK